MSTQPLTADLSKVFIYEADQPIVHVCDQLAPRFPDHLPDTAGLYRVMCTVKRDQPLLAARRCAGYRHLKAATPTSVQAWPDQLTGEFPVLATDAEEAARHGVRQVSRFGGRPMFVTVWHSDEPEPVLGVAPADDWFAEAANAGA